MGPCDCKTRPTNDQGKETTPVEFGAPCASFPVWYSGARLWHLLYLFSQWTLVDSVHLHHPIYTLYTLHLRTSLGTLLVKRMLGASVGQLKRQMVDTKAGKFINSVAVEIVSGISNSQMSLMPKTRNTVFTRVIAACTHPVQRLIVSLVRNIANNEVVKMILQAGMRYALNLGHGKLCVQCRSRDSIFAWGHSLSCQSLCPFCWLLWLAMQVLCWKVHRLCSKTLWPLL